MNLEWLPLPIPKSICDFPGSDFLILSFGQYEFSHTMILACEAEKQLSLDSDVQHAFFLRWPNFRVVFWGKMLFKGLEVTPPSKWIWKKQAPAKSELAKAQWLEMHGLKCDLLSRCPNFYTPPPKKTKNSEQLQENSWQTWEMRTARSLQNIPWKAPTRDAPPQPEN